MKTCYSCFNQYEGVYTVCPHCGHIDITEPKEPIHLLPGTVLANRYIIGESVGSGGFGIIYKAYDLKLETIIAVKEFFNSRLMTRTPGQEEVIVYRKTHEEYVYRKRRFLAEARAMADFNGHQSIPNVFEFFEENNTAYIVMEFLDGIDLNSYLKRKGRINNINLALFIVNEVGAALTALHSKGIIHRDVAPDNIFICRGKTLKIKLLDLGAALLLDETDDAIDIVLKPGYSPAEQYEEGNNVGPWCDVYALGATLYMLLTGIKPEESTNRKIEDRLLPPSAINRNIPENLNNAIMKAMAVDRHMRFKTVDDFLRAINGEKKVVSLHKEKKRRTAKRAMSVAVACLLVVAICFSVFKIFNNKRGFVGDTSLVILYYDPGNNHPITALTEDFKSMVEKEFKSEIEITLVSCATIEEYQQKIQDAANQNALPTIFESTWVSDEKVLSGALDLSNVVKSEEFQSSEVLKNLYDDCYPERNKVPLEIEMPIAFVRPNGFTLIDFSTRQKLNTFSSVDDLLVNMKKKDGTPFEKGKQAGIDEANRNFVEQNLGIRDDYCKEDRFFIPNIETKESGKTGNTTAVLLTSSNRLSDKTYIGIERETGQAQKRVLFYLPEDGSNILCRFTNEWSIGNCENENQQHAAELFLSFMLSEKYQQKLQMPLNSNQMFKKITAKFDSQTPEEEKKETVEKLVQAIYIQKQK